MIFYSRLEQIRQVKPLLHCVSNLVSANDCANLALAIGASPMMAQALEEMVEITRISSATVLNTGTPDRERFEVCRVCGETAQEIAQPIVLDPVGVGASRWRREQIQALLERFRPTILRANLGEAMALCGQAGREHGVDSMECPDLDRRSDLASELALRYGTTVLLTGKEDIICDGHRGLRVSGGSERMSRVTGTGCMLSVLCGAFAAVEPDAVSAATLAAAFWKRCAERADLASHGQGIGGFHVELMNVAEQMTVEELEDSSNIQEII